MKKEEIVIKNALRMTKEADDQLSIYATKNRDCIKVKQTIRNREELISDGRLKKTLIEFYIVNHISDMLIKLKHYLFLIMLIFQSVLFMSNG